jgi:hypothetical protein
MNPRLPEHRNHSLDEHARREIEETLGYYSEHPERIEHKLDELSREWSIERILETNASILCLAGLALGTVQHKRKWFVLPAMAAGFLLSRAVRGRPPGRFLLRRLGFRPEREIEAERRGCERLWMASNGRAGEKVRAVPPWTRGMPVLEPAARRDGPAARRGEAVPVKVEEPASRKPWYRKARYWIPIAIILLLVILRLLLTPIVESQLRASLEKMEGFSASFEDISLSLLELKFTGHGFTVDRIPPADPLKPLLRVNRIEVDLFGKPLLTGKMVGQARFIEPRFHIVVTPEAPPPELPDIASAMAKAAPFRFDRIEIRKGEMTVVEAGEKDRPEMRMGDIEATVENIETGTQLGNRMPSVFAARARFQESGEMRMFYTANLLSRALTFAGQAEIKGLKLVEINPFIASKTGMKVEKGEFDVFTSFQAVDGKIMGGVKPFLKHVDMEAWDDDLVTELKTALADVTMSVLSDRVPGREAMAGIIPFSGDITSPEPHLLPAVLTVVRNAFVIGLASGFGNLPPPEATTAAKVERGEGAGREGE